MPLVLLHSSDTCLLIPYWQVFRENTRGFSATEPNSNRHSFVESVTLRPQILDAPLPALDSKKATSSDLDDHSRCTFSVSSSRDSQRTNPPIVKRRASVTKESIFPIRSGPEVTKRGCLPEVSLRSTLRWLTRFGRYPQGRIGGEGAPVDWDKGSTPGRERASVPCRIDKRGGFAPNTRAVLSEFTRRFDGKTRPFADGKSKRGAQPNDPGRE